MFFGIFVQALYDYYRCGAAQKKEDEADARDFIWNRYWKDYNVVGLDREWVLPIIEMGKEKVDEILKAREREKKEQYRKQISSTYQRHKFTGGTNWKTKKRRPLASRRGRKEQNGE